MYFFYKEGKKTFNRKLLTEDTSIQECLYMMTFRAGSLILFIILTFFGFYLMQYIEKETSHE